VGAVEDAFRVTVSALNRRLDRYAGTDPATISAYAVPVRPMLGVSLSRGRYSIITRVRGNARKAGDLTAGEAELRSLPT
jgi:hypothetical protein